MLNSRVCDSCFKRIDRKEKHYVIKEQIKKYTEIKEDSLYLSLYETIEVDKYTLVDDLVYYCDKCYQYHKDLLNVVDTIN
jgi:hypothetical protein